jgi:hypothetical protein
VLGSGPGDIVIDFIDSGFDRDSVLQFISACEGADFSLTLSNVFEIELLCDEWSVSGKLIRQKVIEFIEQPPSGKSVWLRRLLFCDSVPNHRFQVVRRSTRGIRSTIYILC